MDEEEKDSINFLSESYNEIEPDVYETFDFANFLKNKKEYEKSIELYSSILSKINEDHEIYPKV